MLLMIITWKLKNTVNIDTQERKQIWVFSWFLFGVKKAIFSSCN